MGKVHAGARTVGRGRSLHLARLGQIQRQRLLTEHIQPGLHRRHRHRVMHIVGRADADEVQFLAAEHVVIVAIQPGDVMLLLHGRQSGLAHIAGGDYADVTAAPVRGHVMVPGDAAGPDNADP